MKRHFKQMKRAKARGSRRLCDPTRGAVGVAWVTWPVARAAVQDEGCPQPLQVCLGVLFAIQAMCGFLLSNRF